MTKAGVALALLGLWCAIVLAACGGGGNEARSRPVSSESLPQPSFRPAHPSAPGPVRLTKTDARLIKAVVSQDPYVRHVAAKSQVRVAEVVPWVSEGGAELVGGVAHVNLHPPVDFEDRKLPAIIFRTTWARRN